MATLNVNIIKSDILLEVGRLTGYIGKKKSNEDGTYEKVASTKADDAMLSQFWLEGVDHVVNELKAFHGSFSSEDTDKDGNITEGLFCICSMSDNWVSSLEHFINTSISKFLVNYIVCRWLMITVKFEDAIKYDEIANKSMSSFVDALYTFERPNHGYNR